MICQVQLIQTQQKLIKMIKQRLILITLVTILFIGCDNQLELEKMSNNLKEFKNIETEKVSSILVHSTIDTGLSTRFNETVYLVEGGYLIKREFYSQFFTNRESLVKHLEKVQKHEIEQMKELNFQRDNFDELFYENFIQLSNSFVINFKMEEHNLAEIDRKLNSIAKNNRLKNKKQVTAYLGKLIIEKNVNARWLKVHSPSKNQFIGASIALNGTIPGQIVDVYELVNKELEKDIVEFSKNQFLINLLK
jgi:hypothetical protein